MTAFMTVVGWTLIHFVWQACAIALPVAVLLRLTTRRAPNVRYLVGCAGLVAMLVTPLATARLLTVQTDSGVTTSNTEQAVFHEPQLIAAAAPERPMRAPSAAASVSYGGFDGDRAVSVITILWLAGVALLLARMAGGWWQVRRLHRYALAMDASHW